MNEIQQSTLVPADLLKGQDTRCFLSAVYPDIAADAKVGVIDFPQYEAALVYLDRGVKPVLAGLLEALPTIKDYNRIVASYTGGALYLAVAQGGRLLLANTYAAADFTTAEYFIFLAMKTLQLNPEISVIRFDSPLDEEQEISLSRYFKSVEPLQ